MIVLDIFEVQKIVHFFRRAWDIFSYFISLLDALCLPTSGTAKEEAAQEAPDCLVKYFSVVWCKASKKKHKKWEGDAILITKGKSVILKDMEGKDIGRGTVDLHTCSREHLAENQCFELTETQLFRYFSSLYQCWPQDEKTVEILGLFLVCLFSWGGGKTAIKFYIYCI